MSQSLVASQELENCSFTNVGAFSELDRFVFSTSKQSFQLEGKVFLKEILKLTGAEISLNRFPPKRSIPFYHKHQLNEEIYIFLSGEGEFQIDDRIFPIQEGTILRVDPEGVRCFRNTSETEELTFITIQVRKDSYQGSTIEDGIPVEKRVSWVGKERIE
ncbi:MAG: cupin domain-containing protein [Cyanobacteria bacterium P01_E01_bin.42]